MEMQEKNRQPLYGKTGKDKKRLCHAGLDLGAVLWQHCRHGVRAGISFLHQRGRAVGVAIAGALVLIFDLFLMPGLKILNPNEALVLTLFGKYHGTLKKDGYFWVNPFCEASTRGRSRLYDHCQRQHQLQLWGHRKISLKTMTLNNEKQTVNDERGNPIVDRHHCHLGGLWTPPRRCSTYRTTGRFWEPVRLRHPEHRPDVPLRPDG